MNPIDSQFFDKTNNEKFYFDQQRLFNFKYLSIVNSRNNILYQVVEKIGKGGNGVVYLVICLSGKYQGQLFALKLFQNIRNSERLQRFYKEIAIVAKLNHPSIIRHYDDGEFGVYDNKYPFLITSYIPDNLHYIITQPNQSRLNFYDALIYSVQLLSALKECEDQGVIHRDIKPKNIFINNKTAILGDFGLMKLVDSEVSGEEFKEDTDSLCYGQALHYRCPDVIQYVLEGKSLTTQANIFSMGLVLAQMFGGKNPQKKQSYPNTTPKKRYTSPILWNEPKFGYIGPSEDEVENPKTYGDKILWILSLMLEQEPENRPNAGKVLNELISVFTSYIKDKKQN